MNFFQNSKNTKALKYPNNIFESTLMIQKIEVILKIAKTTFFSSLFQVLKKGRKKRVFFDFKDQFNLLDHQTTLKNIARILYDFCIFGILKKTHKFVKIGKTSGNTLVFSDP